MMTDPALDAFLSDAWATLARGVADAKHPARTPVMATVSEDGKPQARTLVLRAASRSDARLEVHTDSATPKVTALRKTPFAALHVWVPRSNLQIRMSARVNILTGDAVETAWARVPPGARVSYGTHPVPGSVIAQADAYDTPADRARFAVLQCHVEEMDLLHLGTPHRRARFRHVGDWTGSWIAP